MYRIILTSLTLMIVFSNAVAQPKRKLVWSDEFNYKGLPDPKNGTMIQVVMDGAIMNCNIIPINKPRTPALKMGT